MKTEKYFSVFSKDLLAKNQYKYEPPIAPGTCTGCGWVTIRTVRWMDYWNVGTDSQGNLISLFYRGSSPRSVVTEWVYVPNAHGYNEGFGDYAGGNSYHEHYNESAHGPGINENPHDYEREEEELPYNVGIDPSIYEFPCLTKVLNKILGSNSALFAETIGQFIENPKYDLIFTVAECDRTDNACTDGNSVDTTGEIFINIEDTSQNPINFASAIFHEAIHAELFRFVNEHHDGVVDPNDKPQLFEYFQRYASTIWEEDIDHIYMTQYFIIPIAKALRALDNSQYPLNYYKTFAWDGLRKWDPNNSLGITDEEYLQYRNEVTLNFSIKCDD